ncbi:MAG: sigma 54-interacting transcriptional regulator [Myxococcales bacterium]|nr:sigma 54-interacting transcriptional regulator [Myxococcales bacterium]
MPKQFRLLYDSFVKDGLVQRGSRKPFYVQVVTEPALSGCWSVNLSVTGIGLLAFPRSAEEGPREGQQVGLEFFLPETRQPIRADGEVRWRHDVPAGGETRCSLGVSFRRFEGSDQAALQRYLIGHQLTVGVLHASPEVRKAAPVLEAHVQLRFADELEEVSQLLERGDLSAIIVCGDDPRQVLELVESSASARLPLRDLAPPLVLCATLPPSKVVGLFNSGRIYRALWPPVEEGALQDAVLQACRDHSVRIEQQRVALELERNLLRDRARRGSAAAPVGEGPGFDSPAMKWVMEMVRKVAPHRVAVLLEGETGTGKEVLAQAIHALSGRRSSPFVVQDCGALTETLLESELFGHIKGAFTGAVADHPGLFLIADKGTIFLDEIENTSPNLQAKLLRVIETGEFRPVGGAEARRVDVRLVAASNRDLAEEVREGRFRADLFYRLNTFVVRVPPLRERMSDILPLARHFVDHFNRELAKSALGLGREAEEALLQAEWPGNIRELRNAIERAVLLSGPGEPIGPSLLPPLEYRPAGPKGEAGSLRRRLEELERALISEALHRSGGVFRRAAATLKMDPVTLGRRARRLGLQKPA